MLQVEALALLGGLLLIAGMIIGQWVPRSRTAFELPKSDSVF